MNKTLLAVLFLIILIGCQNPPSKVVFRKVCKGPYIEYGSVCCLDQNANNICDMNESKAEINETKTKIIEEVKECSDECSSNTCLGFDHIACLEETDGCKYKENLGKIIGKCDLECFSDSDCEGDICSDYICKEIETVPDEEIIEQCNPPFRCSSICIEPLGQKGCPFGQLCCLAADEPQEEDSSDKCESPSVCINFCPESMSSGQKDCPDEFLCCMLG